MSSGTFFLMCFTCPNFTKFPFDNLKYKQDEETIVLISISAIAINVILASCYNNVKEVQEPVKIENTLRSVSYFRDTVGYDIKELLNAFNVYNEAIAEFGYPDAGYELWVIEDDDTEIRFMVQGSWPDIET